jgi:hypothetical protein
MQGNPPESGYLDGASSWTQAQSGALTGKFRAFGDREIVANEQGSSSEVTSFWGTGLKIL